MNLTISKNGHQQFLDILESLYQSTVEEINIYNQAYLQLDRPLIRANQIHIPTKYELPVSFKLSGAINGSIVCLLDTYKKVINQEEQSSFQSLYIESMNILLGKICTKFDDNYNLGLEISAPQILNPDEITKLIHYGSSDKLNMGYTFISNFQEFDCRIIYLIDRKQNLGAL